MKNSFLQLKQALYLVAESTGTSVLLLTMALVISSKPEHLVLVAFSLFLMAMTGLYMLMKFFDALAIIKEIEIKLRAFYTIVLVAFYVGSISAALLIAVVTFKDFLEKIQF